MISRLGMGKSITFFYSVGDVVFDHGILGQISIVLRHLAKLHCFFLSYFSQFAIIKCGTLGKNVKHYLKIR